MPQAADFWSQLQYLKAVPLQIWLKQMWVGKSEITATLLRKNKDHSNKIYAYILPVNTMKQRANDQLSQHYEYLRSPPWGERPYNQFTGGVRKIACVWYSSAVQGV